MKKILTLSQRISFLDGNHLLQTQYDNLYKKLVPSSGDANTIEGEAIRAVSRLFYEYCNNGNCNAIDRIYSNEGEECTSCSGYGYFGNDIEDKCLDCGGSGEYERNENVDGNIRINTYFGKILEHLREFVPNCEEELDNVESLITDNNKSCNYDYTQEELDVYNRLTEIVIKWIMSKGGNYRKKRIKKIFTPS